MIPHKYLIRIITLLILTPLICSSQQQDVAIRVIQDESYPAGDFQTNLTLKKKAFKLKILLDSVGGVYVFASVRDSVYRFTENSPIRDFPYLKLLELKEEDQFNNNRELSLSETGWSYWFYSDSAKSHSFDPTIYKLDRGRFVCTRYIKQLYDVAEKKVIKIRNIETPLYLFFVAVKDYDASGKPVTELMRRKIKIDWVDD